MTFGGKRSAHGKSAFFLFSGMTLRLSTSGTLQSSYMRNSLWVHKAISIQFLNQFLKSNVGIGINDVAAIGGRNASTWHGIELELQIQTPNRIFHQSFIASIFTLTPLVNNGRTAVIFRHIPLGASRPRKSFGSVTHFFCRGSITFGTIA